ncbi:unnamed protein product [Arctogadus glacialis]
MRPTKQMCFKFKRLRIRKERRPTSDPSHAAWRAQANQSRRSSGGRRSRRGPQHGAPASVSRAPRAMGAATVAAAPSRGVLLQVAPERPPSILTCTLRN